MKYTMVQKLAFASGLLLPLQFDAISWARGPVDALVVAERDITPRDASLHGLTSVRLQSLADGRRKLVIETSPLASGAERDTYYEIDFSIGAFRLLDPAEARARGMTTGLGLNSAEQSGAPVPTPELTPAAASTADAGPICGPGPEPGCESPCSGTHYVQVETWDPWPFNMTLTRTTASASWFTSGNAQCIERSQANGTPWAANPSPIDTHWFISSWQQSGGNIHEGDLNYSIRANYYNYDFGTNSLITRVSTIIWVAYSWATGQVGVSFSHIPSGEYSLFLSGHIFESGSSNC